MAFLLMMKKIELRSGLHTIVDDEDFEELSKFRWKVDPNGPLYVRRYVETQKKGVRDRKCFLMHREIMGCVGRFSVVDHINGNRLDNRKENLRICTIGENCRNQQIRSQNTSGVKGVTRAKSGRWIAKLMFNYKHVSCGTYDTIEQAAAAYDAKAKELFGEFAKTNAQLLGNDFSTIKT